MCDIYCVNVKLLNNNEYNNENTQNLGSPIRMFFSETPNYLTITFALVSKSGQPVNLSESNTDLFYCIDIQNSDFCLVGGWCHVHLV